MWKTRHKPRTNWNTRKGVGNDLGYLITQLGTLCNEIGQKIIFHTGKWKQSTTDWKTRKKPNK